MPRAGASRRNGALTGQRSRQGALIPQRAEDGLCAQRFIALHGEDPKRFEALADALADDLAPEGALQGLLARRLAFAAWRLERADRIEGELFALRGEGDVGGWGRLGLALVRDGNGSRSFDTLLRYRGSAMAELWRALRALKALQAEAARDEAAQDEMPDAPAALCEQPIEPEAGGNPGEIAAAPPAEAEGPEETSCPAPPGARAVHACARPDAARQRCATMRHLCAVDAPPSAGGA